MASITLGGTPTNTNGSIPKVGSIAPDFTLTSVDLKAKTLSDYDGFRKILNIFPSVGTGICASSVRKFNEEAGKLKNTKVLCISKDLPFAQKSFCAADGLENVEMLADYKTTAFANKYGLLIMDGIFESLLSRVVLVLDANNRVLYSEQVPEIGQEPDYKAALKALI